MLIPLVAIVAANTLLTVILGTWGPSLDKHRLRRGSTTLSRGWQRWGELIVRRRWLAGVAGLAAVLALAVPALSMNTGQPRANSLAQTGSAANALHGLERPGVPSGVRVPIPV